MRRLTLGWTTADPLITVFVALVIVGPAIFTDNGFAFDYTNHMWMVWVQDEAITRHLLPTYFLNSPSTGIFFPMYMFYGATLYAVTGALAALLGGRVVVAYVGVSLLSVIAAYGGMLWLARQCRVRSWLAHAPALTFVASAYFVTNIYGRGAWTEFVATSMLPLVAASGLDLLHGPRVRLRSAALLVVSVVMFAGSHNITLLLGTLMFAVLGLGLVVAIGRDVLPSPGRAGLVAALAILGIAVNGWFLVPDLAHAGSTQIGAGPLTPWANTTEFNTFSTLFNPFRLIPGGSILPALYVQAPVWFLVWSLAAACVFWRAADRRLRRAAVVLLGLLTLILLCIMDESVWNALPRTLKEIQFPFRLNTYVSLTIAGLVIVAALALQRSGARLRRVFEVGLAGAALASCVLCLWQLWVPNTRAGASYADWHGIFASTRVTPATWNSSGVYNDVSAPVVPDKGGMLVDPNLITSDRVTLTLNPPAGFTPFAMNMGAGPYAVSISGGLERVGRDAADNVVVRRRFKATGPVTFTLATAGGSIAAGQALSAAALAVLLLALVFVLGRRVHARRRPRSGNAGDPEPAMTHTAPGASASVRMSRPPQATRGGAGEIADADSSGTRHVRVDGPT